MFAPEGRRRGELPRFSAALCAEKGLIPMKVAVKQHSAAHLIAAAAAGLGMILNFSKYALGQSIWMLLAMIAFAVVVYLTGKKDLMISIIVFLSWLGVQTLISLFAPTYGVWVLIKLLTLVAEGCGIGACVLLLLKKKQHFKTAALLCLVAGGALALSALIGFIVYLTYGYYFLSGLIAFIHDIGFLLPFGGLFVLAASAELTGEAGQEQAAQQPGSGAQANGAAYAAPANAAAQAYADLFEEKNVGLCILYSILTFGIYGYIWYYSICKKCKLAKQEQPDVTGEFLLLLFVPFYSIYWIYKKGKEVTEAAPKWGITVADNSTMYLLLSLLLGVGFLVSVCMLQNDLNAISRAARAVCSGQAPAQPQYQQAPTQPQYQQAPAQPQYQQAPAQPQYQQAPAQPQYQQTPAQSAGDEVEKLRRLKALLDEGILTQQEYDAKKNEILSKL